MVDMTPIGSKHAPSIEVEEFDHILFLVDFHDMKGFEETAEHGESRVHDGKTEGKDGNQNGDCGGPF